jgi:branched-chain amino acid transport system ATP-binding protein
MRRGGTERHAADRRDLHAFYGKSHVLHGVHFDVVDGRDRGLLGRNGSGRSTTAKAIMGMVEATGTWLGPADPGLKPFEIAHLGIGYVPRTATSSPT